ncbi:MAG: hypothetical protein FJ303_09415 [Planctomycetes bacterium]|nr:hypothetical protein [Planctomycetota bacterium]
MEFLTVALIVAGFVPLALAFWNERATSLSHALLWTMLTWTAWGAVFLWESIEQTRTDTGRYIALCLVGCAGIAVLGARRPHVAAWDFVVLGLLSVMLLPLVEAALVGTESLGGLRVIFMTGAIAVGILNYLPTRQAVTAIWLFAACSAEIALVHGWVPSEMNVLAMDLPLAFTPWLAWLSVALRPSAESEFDSVWLDFRDRWGFVWSQRVHEQFNNAAHHAGWPIVLTWFGLMHENDDRPLNDPVYVDTLRKALQRFVEDGDE